MKTYYGVVESRADPKQLGRLKVRVLGLHTEDKVLLPTNDLPWAIRYWDNSDNWDSNIKHVILGDPNPNSYGKEVIMDCISRCEHPSTFLFSKDWYMALINIDGTNKLVVNESKIKVI